MQGAQRFEAAIQAFDEAHQRDPRTEKVGGQSYPKELLYAQRLTDWVKRLAPNPSEELLLAARCQHIERWKIPRQNFPAGRKGYLDWRRTLAQFHARRAEEILAEVGYPPSTIQRVRSLLLKEHLKADPEMQLLEDAICLVFLETEFHEFAQKTPEETLLRILRKTWRKMSPRARQIALKLDLDPQDRALIHKAVAERSQ
ncbi:MAG: DUF4202 domain-containing protein [Acidobacteria bacterium]|nr:MAG: DUF4202 domain-containing protein [Acidobacteriota bacterium]